MRHPFLTQLGISAADQVRGPDALHVPPGLNQYAALEWRTAVQEITQKRGEKQIRRWARTIARFLKLCAEHQVFAFANDSVGRNSLIEDVMVKARVQFVRFCIKTKFFDDVKIRNTEREVLMGVSGPILRCWANCTVSDPLFVEWLQKLPSPYRWPQSKIPVNQGTEYFEYRASPELTIWVRRALGRVQLDKYKLGYDIHIPAWPAIPGQPLPTEREIKDFVIDVLWLPLLRTMRPNSMDHRLI